MEGVMHEIGLILNCILNVLTTLPWLRREVK